MNSITCPILRVGIFLALSVFSQAQASSCSDLLASTRETDLDLTEYQFDQVEGRGWQRLSSAGCEAEAEKLLRTYIARNPSTGPTLRWHLAQSLAMQSKLTEAVEIGSRCLKSGLSPTDLDRHWNAYIRGTIAHWQRDKSALEAALAEIQTTSPGRSDADPLRRALEWLHRCFHESYASETCK